MAKKIVYIFSINAGDAQRTHEMPKMTTSNKKCASLLLDRLLLKKKKKLGCGRSGCQNIIQHITNERNWKSEKNVCLAGTNFKSDFLNHHFFGMFSLRRRAGKKKFSFLGQVHKDDCLVNENACTHNTFNLLLKVISPNLSHCRRRRY